VTYWLKMAYFCYIFAIPLSFGALALEFHAAVNRQETRVMGLSSSEDRIYDRS